MQPTLRDRIRGCLLGGAVGDALGAGIEFADLAQIRTEHGPDGVTGYVPAYGRLGAITDDTQLTAFAVEGLLRAAVRSDRGVVSFPLGQWFAYRRWLVTQDPAVAGEVATFPPNTLTSWLLDEPVLHARRAPGNTCLAALARPRMEDPLPPSAASSKGCGSVMRSAPFGLFARPWVSAREVAELARTCSALTHGHPTAGYSSAALAWTVRELVDGRPLADAIGSALAYLDAEGPDAAPTAAAGHTAVELATSGPPTPERVEQLGGGWVAEEALAIAIYCALAAPDARSALLAAVNHGGDSDSTGSICGNLLGAAGGDLVLPPVWVAELEARGVLLQLADDLHEELTRRDQLHGERLPVTGWNRRYPGY